MREILFRGKREDNGNWIYGSFFTRVGECFVIPLPIVTSKAKVDSKTVGQFTGLTDKNGKMIFEGDVIKFHECRGEPDWVGTITYEYCSYIVKGQMPLAYEKPINEEARHCPFELVLSGIDKSTIEVIGNIHDNPELPKAVKI